MTTSPRAGSTGDQPTAALARLAAAPSRRAGAAWALVAVGMMLVGAVLVPSLALTPGVATASTTEGDRALVLGNALAFLGFVPLLTAAHALIGRRAEPVGALLTAYLVLLIRPLALLVEGLALPGSVLLPLGPLVPWVLLLSTGVAAAFAAAALLALAQEARTLGRRIAVAAGVGLLVPLALFSFAPYIAPLTALGVAVALLLGRGRAAQS